MKLLDSVIAGNLVRDTQDCLLEGVEADNGGEETLYCSGREL